MTEAIQYTWWNLIPQHMDPTLVTLGSFPIRWYGLMYLAAFFTTYQVVWKTIQRDKLGLAKENLDDLTTWIIAGILIGARLGYVLFYNLGYYASHPLEAILPFSFEGGFHFTGISGMSFHGGLIGAIIAFSLCVRKHKWNYWQWNNLVFMAAPLGYTWGRLGNFINGELYGRVTDSPIGMLFPMDRTQQLRHPSQLYEMFFEGVFLFFVLQWLYRKPKFKEHMMAFFLMGYGAVRYVIEYLREPDAHIGLNALGFSRGQLLCMAMILAGLVLWQVRRIRLKQ
jgi:phosphatidylglycerol---prolipoprotein diacylglyceryl transferase